jgi:hypothetical protein
LRTSTNRAVILIVRGRVRSNQGDFAFAAHSWCPGEIWGRMLVLERKASVRCYSRLEKGSGYCCASQTVR